MADQKPLPTLKWSNFIQSETPMRNGFTIIELMMTIFILSIVIAVAAPSFQRTIQSNRMAGQANSLLSALNFARSEAVKLGAKISICSSSNQTSCSSSGSWESGWIIFRDTDGDLSVDSGEVILRLHEALSGGNTLRTFGFSASSGVKFDERGMVASSGTLVLCDSRGRDHAKGIVLNISGQARVAIDEDDNGRVNLHSSGGDVSCP